MPAVPGIDSRMIAAKELGPSNWIDALEVLERPVALFFFAGCVVRRAIEERTEEMHGARGAVVVGPAPWVPRQVDRRRSGAVVTAVRREDLVATGVQARHADSVLDRLGPAVGEEDLGGAVKGVVENATRPRDSATHIRAGGRSCSAARLLLDGAHHRGVLVADVGVHQLRGEVQVGGAILSVT